MSETRLLDVQVTTSVMLALTVMRMVVVVGDLEGSERRPELTAFDQLTAPKRVQLSEPSDESYQNYCGSKAVRYFDVRLGMIRVWMYTCDNYHECPKCLQRKADEVKWDIDKALKTCRLGIRRIIDNDEKRPNARRFARSLGKDGYKRFPHEDATLFIYDAGPVIPDEPFDSDIFDYQDAVRRVPKGSRITGSLGRDKAYKPRSSRNHDDMIKVQTAFWVTNSDGAHKNEIAIFRSVLSRHVHERPTDAQSLQKLVTTIVHETETELNSKGFETWSHRWQSAYVRLEEIDWSINLTVYDDLMRELDG